LTVKAAILADIHACEPWMPASRVRGIANLANDLACIMHREMADVA
jgi:uncharacterized protein